MKVLIDTNIILDWLLRREPFHSNAKYIVEKCIFGKKLLIFLCNTMEIISEDQVTIRNALYNEQWMDLEDGLQMECADKMKMDYIITRNTRDFTMSKVTAIEPERFIEIYKMHFRDAGEAPQAQHLKLSLCSILKRSLVFCLPMSHPLFVP